MRTFILTLRIPIRNDYPWKPGQAPFEKTLECATWDAVQYQDCVDRSRRIITEVRTEGKAE